MIPDREQQIALYSPLVEQHGAEKVKEEMEKSLRAKVGTSQEKWVVDKWVKEQKRYIDQAAERLASMTS